MCVFCENFNNLPGNLSDKSKRLGIPISSNKDTIKSINVLSDSTLKIVIETKNGNISGTFEVNGESGEITWTDKPLN